MTFHIISWSLILFGCFFGIGSYPLLDNNEGLYASIARDMLATKQFIVPHLLGLPYLEKPPMLYWLMAASMSVFGVNEGAVRLIPAMAYFLTAVSLQRFVTRVSGSEKTGLSAALMLVTALPLLVWGREILCDMLMACFFSAALFELYLWHEQPKKCHIIAFYILLALAVLAKGFTAVILAGGITVGFYLWEHKPLRQMFRLLSLPGLLLFIIIIAPWHIAASLQEPGFAWFYFINEHVLRFINMREPHDYHMGAWWYYLPRIMGGMVPWTLFLLILLYKTKPSSGAYPSAARFLWSWFLVCLFFFSLAGSKANYYMIIGMAPLLGLIALHIKAAMETGHRVVRSLTCGSFAIMLILVWFSAYFCTDTFGAVFSFCETVPKHYMIGLVLYCAVCMILCWRIPQYWLAPFLGSHIVLLLPLLINGVANTGDTLSQKTVAEELNTNPAGQVALYETFEDISSLAFYLKKPILMVDSNSSDLLYGEKQRVKPAMFLTLKDWAARKPYIPMVVLKSRLFALMNALHSQHADMKHVCIPDRFDRVVIVSMCDHGH